MKEYLLRMLWCITTFLIFKVILYIYQLKNKKKRVLLFGLSGNPPTGESGHRGIIQEIEQLNIFDEIWILPVYQHTFNSKKNLLPFETRMELCRLNFQDFKTCKVLPIEKDLFFKLGGFDEKYIPFTNNTFNHCTTQYKFLQKC